HLEFLECIDRRKQEVGVEIRVGVFDAIQDVMVIVDTLAGDVQGEGVTCPAHALLPLRGGGTVGGGSGRERNQLQVITPIEGKLHDAAIFDYGSEFRGLCLEHGRATGNLDCLGDIA